MAIVSVGESRWKPPTPLPPTPSPSSKKPCAKPRLEREEIECLAHRPRPRLLHRHPLRHRARARLATRASRQTARHLQRRMSRRGSAGKRFFRHGQHRHRRPAQRTLSRAATKSPAINTAKSPRSTSWPPTRRACTSRFSPDELFIGPEATRWFATGKILFPNAATLARLAASRTEFSPRRKTRTHLPARNQFRQSPAPARFAGRVTGLWTFPCRRTMFPVIG